MSDLNEPFGNSEQLPAPSAPQGGGVEALPAKWLAAIPSREERSGDRVLSAEAAVYERCADDLMDALTAQPRTDAAQRGDDDELVTIFPSLPGLPRWLLDAAERIERYMRTHHRGDWSVGGIQSRRDGADTPSAPDRDAEIEALKSDLRDYMDAANHHAGRAERLAEELRIVTDRWRSAAGGPYGYVATQCADQIDALLREQEEGNG